MELVAGDEDAIFIWMSYILIAFGVVTFTLLLIRVAPYGRYSGARWLPFNEFNIDSRLAWLIQESPAFFVPLLVWYWRGDGVAWKADYVNILILALYLIHYFYRCFIYSYLIRSGNKSAFVILFSAITVCTFNGYLQSKYHISAKYPSDWIWQWNFIIGLLLFFCGMFINIHSDHVLRNLRKPGETGYKIPKGGMFELVSGANYLGEIIEWFGYATAAWSLPAFAFAFFTISNIGPRAVHHHRWYCNKFEDYPKGRKALIPYIL